MNNYISFWRKNFFRIIHGQSDFKKSIAHYKRIYKKERISVIHFIEAFKAIPDPDVESYFYQAINQGIHTGEINPKVDITDKFMTRYFFDGYLLVQLNRQSGDYNTFYTPYRQALNKIENEYRDLRAEKYYSGHEDTLIPILEEYIRNRTPLSSFIEHYKLAVGKIGYLIFIFRTFEQKYSYESIYQYYWELLTSAIDQGYINTHKGSFNQNTVAQYIFGLSYSTLIHEQTPKPVVQILADVVTNIRNTHKGTQKHSHLENEQKLANMLISTIKSHNTLDQFVRSYTQHKYTNILLYFDRHTSDTFTDHELHEYFTSVLNSACKSKTLILPQQNSRKHFSHAIFGKDFGRSLDNHKGERFTRIFNSFADSYRLAHTKKALVQQNSYSQENGKYSNIGTDSLTKQSINEHVHNALPLGELLDEIYENGQIRIISYLMAFAFSDFSDLEILQYIQNTYAHISIENQTGFGRKNIVRTVLGDAVYKSYLRDDASKNDRFRRLITTAYDELKTNCAFLPVCIEETFLWHLESRTPISEFYSVLKSSYHRNVSHGIINHLVTKCGQSKFEEYINDCIDSLDAMDSPKVPSGIEETSKSIMGFPFHSIVRYSTSGHLDALIKSFYKVWFRKKHLQYRDYSVRKKIYSLLNYTNQEIQT